ncbi:MAG: FMN-binding protein [bacterium]|nr:FMN-binding protein [bacterium]
MTTNKRNGWIGLAAMVVLGAACIWGSDPLYKAIDGMTPKAEAQAGLTDGTYTWQSAEFDSSGYKDVVSLTVAGGKITAAEWDCVNVEGVGKKQLSKDGQYSMTENGPTWAEQSEALCEYVVKNQTAEGLANAEGKCDAIASVSISVGNFVKGIEECLSQAAGGAETLTGSAEGFGGAVTATVVRTDGVITACTLEGKEETPEIGGAALPELEKQVVAANGIEIDGVSGATITTKAVKAAVADALGLTVEEETKAETKPAETAAAAEVVEIDGGLQIGQIYAAAHGTSCFTEAVAVVKDDVIVAAYLDEFQFISSDADVKGVPNSEEGFGEAYADGMVLCSKRENAAYYSKNMAEKGGSTVAIDANYDAIQKFVVGKTIDEIDAVAAGENVVDAVSGATLADTANYLKAIADAARAAQKTQAVEFNGNSDSLKLNVAYAAAHGTKCFATAAALTDGQNIILSYIDEFQFISSDAGVKGVPNSDEKFGENIAEGNLLCSKRENAEYYSKNMAEKGGSTVAIDANYDAIQNHINGMSIADVTALAGQESPADAISGATLADTAGYLHAVLAAATDGMAVIDGGLQIGQIYAAAHGTSCFTEAVAVVKDDVIVAAYLDEFQFISRDADVKGVPNSEEGFGEAYADGMVLCSKRENAAYYSKNMAEKGGSTVAIDANYDAIQKFVVGKTIDEIDAVAAGENVVDAVSGATLADTANYLKAIADAARAAQKTQAVEFNGNSDSLKLNVAYAAAHGTKCFATAAALTDGQNIILSYIDEFQFISSDAGVKGVPNSDEKFGENIAEGNLLCSKRENAEYYSKNMAEKGGSTVAIDANYDAIQNHINGMSIADVTVLAGQESPADAISGATLADTAGYLHAVLAAAQK